MTNFGAPTDTDAASDTTSSTTPDAPAPEREPIAEAALIDSPTAEPTAGLDASAEHTPDTPGPALDASAELLDVFERDAGADGGETGEPAEEPPPPSPYDRPGSWFVVHTYAGYENKVKQNLEQRIRSQHAEDEIFEVAIPMEDVIEFKGGQRRVVPKKVFPGYVLVRMEMNDGSWRVVRDTPNVTGFVGPSGRGEKPTPLSRKEVEDILGVAKPEGPAAEKKARPRVEFEEGEQVRVVTGPFADFNGAIAEIDVDRSKLKVLVNIFGRETPVELEFGQVAKL
jgi:transcriptional antiterminator NusG